MGISLAKTLVHLTSKVPTFTMNSQLVVLIAIVAIAHLSEAVPGVDTNGACNCSRQTSGECAPTEEYCISGSCTCSESLGVCVGSCGGSSILDWFGREEIKDRDLNDLLNMFTLIASNLQ